MSETPPNETSIPAEPEVGCEFTIESGDTLPAIIQAYCQQGGMLPCVLRQLSAQA